MLLLIKLDIHVYGDKLDGDSLYYESGFYMKLLKNWSSDTWTDMYLVRVKVDRHEVGVRFRGF